jgi:transposase
MSGFINGADRSQVTLFPESLDEYVAEESPVRVIDVFVDELDLASLGFKTEAADTGRPGYHPSMMLKLFIYGYMNRVQSGHRLEREAQRNVELMWLTGRLAPDFKTICDFRRENGKAIQKVCRQFVVLCRKLRLFSEAFVAIDGSKFKALNNRDKNFTKAKVKRRLQQIDESIARYLSEMESLDRRDAEALAKEKSQRLSEKIEILKGEFSKGDFIYHAEGDEYECPAGHRLVTATTRPEAKRHAHTSADGRASVRHAHRTNTKDAGGLTGPHHAHSIQEPLQGAQKSPATSVTTEIDRYRGIECAKVQDLKKFDSSFNDQQ